jgi:hypothetical protein
MDRQEQEKRLVDCLTQGAELFARSLKAFPRHLASVRSMPQLVLEYGRLWTPSVLPLDVPIGAKGNCFQNATELAFENKDLTYCEGYGSASSVLRTGLEIPMVHAWCIDPSGRVIDSTWDEPENGVYYGIPFLNSFLRSLLIKNNMFGIIESGVLQLGLHPPEKWLKPFPPAGGNATE